MVPNAAELRLPLGARKFVWLNRLNASRRNSRLPAGHGIAKRLLATKSTCQNIGARTLLRGELPNGWLGSVGATTVAGFRYRCGVRSFSGISGSPIRFGR